MTFFFKKKLIADIFIVMFKNYKVHYQVAIPELRSNTSTYILGCCLPKKFSQGCTILCCMQKKILNAQVVTAWVKLTPICLQLMKDADWQNEKFPWSVKNIAILLLLNLEIGFLQHPCISIKLNMHH